MLCDMLEHGPFFLGLNSTKWYAPVMDTMATRPGCWAAKDTMHLHESGNRNWDQDLSDAR